jgi:hypothetical protein
MNKKKNSVLKKGKERINKKLKKKKKRKRTFE